MSDINNKAICTHCGDSVPHDKYEQHLRDLHADADDSSDGDWWEVHADKKGPNQIYPRPLSLSMIQTEIFKCEFDATRKGRMVQYDYNLIIMVQGL